MDLKKIVAALAGGVMFVPLALPAWAMPASARATAGGPRPPTTTGITLTDTHRHSYGYGWSGTGYHPDYGYDGPDGYAGCYDGPDACDKWYGDRTSTLHAGIGGSQEAAVPGGEHRLERRPKGVAS